MVQAAYLLYRLHHVTPSQFYEMSYGEKAVVTAFLNYEIEQKLKEKDAIEKVWKGE